MLAAFSPCIMSAQYTGGGYHKYTGVFSTLEGYHEYTGGYHDKCGGKVIRKTTEFVWKPQCTEYPLVYS